MGTEEKQVQNRKVFLDQLRVAATLAVVLLHSITGVRSVTDMGEWAATERMYSIMLDLVTWCVPVFVLISGYLFLNPARQFTWKEMLYKYCRRIVLALIVFGVPFACMELILNGADMSPSVIGQAFVMVCKGQSWSHLWYLYLILILYIVTPALKWVLKRIPVAGVYLTVAVLFVWGSVLRFTNIYLGVTEWAVLPDWCIYFFYYLCGYLFVRHDTDNGEKAIKKGSAKAALPIAIVLWIVVMTAWRVNGGFYVQTAYEYPFTVVLSLLLFAYAKCMDDTGKVLHPAVKYISEISFAVYLIHPLFINLAYKYWHLTPLQFAGKGAVLVFWLVFVLLSLVTAWIMSKIRPLKRYVL